MVKLIRVALPLALLLAFGSIAYAQAIQEPDIINTRTKMMFRNLLEDNDRLLVFHYRLVYNDTNDIPDDTADETFLFRLQEAGGGSDIGITTPYPYFTNTNGYQQGGGGIYIDGSENITWGSTYHFKIIGSPAHFDSPTPTTEVLNSSHYTDADNQTANQEALGDYIISVAKLLEIEYNVELCGEAEGVEVLNADGDAYFTQAVPGLRNMCPDIFYLSAEAPTFEAREWGANQSAAYEQRFAGTNFSARVTAAGDFLGVSYMFLFGSFIMIVALAMVVVSHRYWQDPTPGLIAGALVLIMGVLLGGIPMAMKAIMGLIAALFLGYLFFFRHG